VLPTIGFAVILIVLWYNVKDQKHPWTSPAYIGLGWAAIGLIGALLATTAVARMRRSLAQELGITVDSPSSATPEPVGS
jgi:multisubunit Na+/H+ antiporter MnhB subunit